MHQPYHGFLRILFDDVKIFLDIEVNNSMMQNVQ